jgi:hypothetical protein
VAEFRSSHRLTGQNPKTGLGPDLATIRTRPIPEPCVVFVGTDPRLVALSFTSHLCDGHSERLSPRSQWLCGLSRNLPFVRRPAGQKIGCITIRPYAMNAMRRPSTPLKIMSRPRGT